MLTGRLCGGTPESGLPSSQIEPSRRLLEAGEHPQQRGLAAAGGAEQRVELALVDGERLVVDGDEAAEPLGDGAELDEGLRRRVIPRLEFSAHRAEDVLCQGRLPPDRRRHHAGAPASAPESSPLLAGLHFRPDARDLALLTRVARRRRVELGERRLVRIDRPCRSSPPRRGIAARRDCRWHRRRSWSFAPRSPACIMKLMNACASSTCGASAGMLIASSQISAPSFGME